MADEIDGQRVVGFSPLVIRGDDGQNPGPPGEKGDVGPTPSFNIGTVTTVPHGTAASASVDATDPSNPVLNLILPEGPAGANGANGAPGAPGDTAGAEAYTDTKVAALSSVYSPLMSVFVAAPTGVAATDDAAISAAITAAGSTKTVILRVGTYQINSWHIIPDGVDLVGQGGGSSSSAPRTKLVCTTSGAGIEIAGGGSYTGQFYLDGNLTATTPFKRSGGTGANNRRLEKIIVINNAVSGTNANDLALIYGAQNDTWIDCAFDGADRDCLVFDQGYGGAVFHNCKVNTAGRDGLRFSSNVGGGVYPQPTQLAFIGGIYEGNIARSAIRNETGHAIRFYDQQMYSGTGFSSACIYTGSGAWTSLHNPTIQNTPSTKVAGSVGMTATGTGFIIITGVVQSLNFETVLNPDGVSARFFTPAYWIFNNYTTQVGATSGGNTLQVQTMPTPAVMSNAVSAATIVEMNYNATQTAFQAARQGDGTLSYYPGTGFGSPDVQMGRVAAGVWGVKAVSYLLNTGTGATASRPTGFQGALWANTDTKKLDAYIASAWRQIGFDAWSKSLDLRLNPVTLSAGSWSSATTYGLPSAGSASTPYTMTWNTDIGVGTWTLQVAALQLGNAGIATYDYSLDGGSTWVNIATNVDLYAATATVVKVTQLASVVISTPSELVIRVTGTGTKNASSTAWYIPCVAFQAQRTA